MQKITEKG